MNKEDHAPLVSIIIPSYNRAFMIKNSIESVLNQTYSNIELIIVDDASSDNTEVVVKKYTDNRIIYIKQNENLGAAAARNKGLKISNGDFVGFLDSDDCFHQDKIKKQVDLLANSDSNVGAIYCGMNLIDFTSRKIVGQKIHRTNFFENFKNGKFLLTPSTVTILARREALLEVGGFDESLPAHQDTELAIRFCQKYNYLLLDEFLVDVNRNHDQISTNPINHIKAKEIIIKKHLKFLSTYILISLNKQVANFYIHSGDFSKAKFFIKRAYKLNSLNVKTFFQYTLVCFFPRLLRKIST